MSVFTCIPESVAGRPKNDQGAADDPGDASTSFQSPMGYWLRTDVGQAQPHNRRTRRRRQHRGSWGLSDGLDPRALRSLVEFGARVSTAAPVWARAGLLGMLGFAVVTGVLRVTSTIAGRLVVVALAVALVGFVAWGIGR